MSNEIAFFFFGICRVKSQKGHKKAHVRPMTLTFWQKMLNFILL